MNRLIKSIPISILSFTVYIVFTGSIKLYDIVTGIIVSIAVGLITTNIVLENPKKALDPKRFLWLVAYSLKYFFISEVLSHIDVIKRALSPKMSLNPGIVRVPYETNSDYGEALVACSITNTPGTVVVDLDKENKIFYVHWIDVKTTEPSLAREKISKMFDEYAKKIFD